jgi:hypothetical protein
MTNINHDNIVACCLKTGISEAEQTSIASQRFDNTHPRQPIDEGQSIAIQQFCKRISAAANKETIQDGVQYSVGLQVIKGRLQTVYDNSVS